jgi:hypothetical protein
MMGAVTALADFGDPATSDDLELCVYDAAGLMLSVSAPAGGLCASKPCWRASTSVLKYKDTDRTPDGLLTMTLKEGLFHGKTRIRVKAKGANLVMPALTGITSPVTVQLSTAAGACWEAVYAAPFATDDGRTFKDKSD